MLILKMRCVLVHIQSTYIYNGWNIMKGLRNNRKNIHVAN